MSTFNTHLADTHLAAIAAAIGNFEAAAIRPGAKESGMCFQGAAQACSEESKLEAIAEIRSHVDWLVLTINLGVSGPMKRDEFATQARGVEQHRTDIMKALDILSLQTKTNKSVLNHVRALRTHIDALMESNRQQRMKTGLEGVKNRIDIDKISPPGAGYEPLKAIDPVAPGHSQDINQYLDYLQYKLLIKWTNPKTRPRNAEISNVHSRISHDTPHSPLQQVHSLGPSPAFSPPDLHSTAPPASPPWTGFGEEDLPRQPSSVFPRESPEASHHLRELENIDFTNFTTRAQRKYKCLLADHAMKLHYLRHSDSKESERLSGEHKDLFFFFFFCFLETSLEAERRGLVEQHCGRPLTETEWEYLENDACADYDLSHRTALGKDFRRCRGFRPALGGCILDNCSECATGRKWFDRGDVE